MTNSTNQSFTHLPRNLQHLFSSTYGTLMVTGFFMNLAVISIITKKKLLRRSINYYIFNMAVSDVLLSCCEISVRFTMTVTNSGDWHITGVPGQIFCKAVTFIARVSALVSTLSLVFMSLERFFAVVYPTKINLRTCKVRRMLLILTWIIPVLYYARDFYSWTLMFGSCGEFWGFEHQCYVMKVITTFYTVAFIFIPLVVLLVLYGIIIFTLHKQQAVHQNVIPTSHRRIRQKQRKKINLLAFTIVLAFALCYSPMYFYVYIVHSFVTKWKITTSKSFDLMIRFSYVLAYSNATINPLVCIVFNREIKNAVRGMIPHCIRRPFRSQSFDFQMSLRSCSSMRVLEFDQTTAVTIGSIIRLEEPDSI